MYNFKMFFINVKQRANKVRPYAALSFGILAIVLVLIYCAEDTPDRCDDGKPLNTYTQFCCRDQVVNKCGGNTFDCGSKFCYLELLYDKCGGNDYNPAKDFCDPVSQTVYPLCAGQDYNTATHGCEDNQLRKRCGGGLYDTTAQFCRNDNIYILCNGNEYNPIDTFCVSGVTYPKCGGNDYAPATEFCFADTVRTKCGGQEFTPTTHGCENDMLRKICGNDLYDTTAQFCNNNIIYPLCDGKDYAPATEFCFTDTVRTKCGGQEFTPTTHGCENDMLRRKCGSALYDTTVQFCNNGSLYDLCGKKDYIPATQFCFADTVRAKCGGQEFTPTTHGCEDNLLRKRCGNALYDTTTHFCLNDVRYPLCGGKDYAPATQFCFADSVYNKCGGDNYYPQTHFCFEEEDRVYPKCDGREYNPKDEICNTFVYSVTVNSEGIGATSSQNYPAGSQVHITAGVSLLDDKRFVRWETESSGVTFADSSKVSTSFTMPPNAVMVTAVFELLYLVTVESDHANATGGGRYYGPNDTVRISTGTPPLGETLVGKWTTNSSGVTFADENSASTFFIMPPNAVTVKAEFVERLLDARDWKFYRIVKIGSQTWMAENLNHQASSGSSCYGSDTSNCVKYGRLYNWNSAATACPTGWHLPTDAEWDNLMTAVGGVKKDMIVQNVTHTYWEYAGMSLRSKTVWNTGAGYVPGTDAHGFAALPGPYNVYGINNDTDVGLWWSATENTGAATAWLRRMNYNNNYVNVDSHGKTSGVSVRCVKD